MLGGFNYSVLNPLALTPSIAIGDITGDTAALTIAGGTVSAPFTNIGEADSSTGSLELIGGAALINEFHLDGRPLFTPLLCGEKTMASMSPVIVWPVDSGPAWTRRSSWRVMR